MKRYQKCPWYVKMYRWLKYRPLYILRAWISVARWLCAGGVIPEEERDFFRTRKEYIEHILTCYRSLADMKMKHYYYLKELLED